MEVYRRMDILPAVQPGGKTNLPQAERPAQHSFNNLNSYIPTG